MSEQTKKPLNENYNPDVLECLANLSNDEVFTPPKVVNQMLDMFPPETWSNPNLTFLDPACKTGVFLREIAKRLIIGLEDEIPNLNRRLYHIFHNQLYGIAITELTALASRRSVYCSKEANGKYSVMNGKDYIDVSENTPSGNIRFVPINHTWENGKCKYCGASAEQYQRADDLETHAYEFIHTNNPEEIFGMKFDVIIGNPPYQMGNGAGGNGSSAVPIYQKFINNADTMNPQLMAFIVPSRWMTGGKGLDEFRHKMINDKKIKILHDFANSNDCFSGVDIQGGVCYFLKDNNYFGPCRCVRHDKNETSETLRYLVEGNDEIFIRQNKLIPIRDKVWSSTETKPFDLLVSRQKPYGLRTDFFKNEKKYNLPPVSNEVIKGGCRILGIDNNRRSWRYTPSNYPFPKKSNLNKYKIFVSSTYGCDEIGVSDNTLVLPEPQIGRPFDACTETFTEIGPFENETQLLNAVSYYKTKFFRALVGIKKQTQRASKDVYQFVPLQDFSKPWTDKELYEKYKLSEEEIKFIEDNVTPMEDK